MKANTINNQMEFLTLNYAQEFIELLEGKYLSEEKSLELVMNDQKYTGQFVNFLIGELHKVIFIGGSEKIKSEFNRTLKNN